MKILMIISTPFPPEEGIGIHVYNLSKYLMKRGHEVSVLTRGGINFTFSEFEGIKVIKTPFIPIYPFHVKLNGWIINRKLKKFLEENFDIIHLHNPLVPLIKTHLPIVVTMHGSIIENVEAMELVDIKSFFSKIFGKTFSYNSSKKLMLKANKVITISTSVAQQIKKYYNFDKLVIIPNGVDINNFYPSDAPGKYLLYVGRLGHGKGLFDLLDAFKLINKEDLKLIIVGEGELKIKLLSKIEKESISNVELIGHIKNEDLLNVYQNARIFVFPTLYEGLPTAILEAMASGLPIIATNVSGCKDLIKNNYNGILVNPKNPKMLSNSISFLLKDLEKSKYLGKNAREIAETDYSWDIISRTIENEYKIILEKS